MGKSKGGDIFLNLLRRFGQFFCSPETWKVALPLLGLCGLVLYWLLFHWTSNADTAFVNPLTVPPELRGETIAGRKQFRLVVAPGKRAFRLGQSTRTAGVNGDYLGPTIRVDRGDLVDFTVVNGLNEVTTMHWHGLHVPARMDGTPHQKILPGKTWTASFEIDQEAGPMWYHPHPHGATGAQAYQGIAGMLWIDDETSRSLDLPDEYGVDDFPLVIQDREFDREGQFRYRRGQQAPAFGDEILVNGTLGAMLELESRLIRFRLLNGSNARVYHIGFEDDRMFHQIATDGGFLNRAVATTRIILAPGERAEIVVDFSSGGEVMLKSFAEAGMLETVESFFEGAGNGDFNLMLIRPQATERVSHSLPEKLNTINRIDPSLATRTRLMRLGGPISDQGPARNGGQGTELGGAAGARGGGGRRGAGRGIPINGKVMDMHRIDERVRLGDIEIWEIENRSGQMHPFHIHLVQFQILDRDGRPPVGAERGWKDTVRVASGETVRIIAHFERYSDPLVPYMYHCHIMEHEDGGMMGQFLVLEEPAELASLRGAPSVVLYITGLACSHCYAQVELFDQALAERKIELLVITPQAEDASRLKLQGRLISDSEHQWAAWLGLGHLEHSHGTFLLDKNVTERWRDTGFEPFMDVEALVDRLTALSTSSQQ